jgi:diacylglycerol kinase (ATP)
VWAQAPAQRVVLVGGDGTLQAAVNLPGPPRDIALVPAGRANNVAHSLGIPYDWERAAALAVSGDVRPVDLIEARSAAGRSLIVEGVSAGVLAQARAHYHGRNSGNLLSAVGAGVAALSRYNPFEASVSGDVATERLELAQIFIANLPFYAFGLCVAPHADPADAMLDLIGIEAPTRRAVLAALRAIRRGRLLGLTGVHLWRARQAVIGTSGCSPVIGDSRSLGFGPVLLRPVPAGLRLVRP